MSVILCRISRPFERIRTPNWAKRRKESKGIFVDADTGVITLTLQSSGEPE